MAHRYYATDIGADTLFLRGDEAAHLARVLRAQVGDAITVFDGAGRDYACRITAISPTGVECEIISSAPSVSEPDIAVTLFVGYPKGDKLETVIQKAVELGAVKIVPFFSRFCVVTPKKEDQKNERYRRIALEAAKQSGRGIVPEVAMPVSFDEMLRALPDFDAALFCYEEADSVAKGQTGEFTAQPGGELNTQPSGELGKQLSVLNRAAGIPRIALITGAEGGFSAEEAQRAMLVSHCISLGPRILRCETAPLAALSAVMTLTGNLQ